MEKLVQEGRLFTGPWYTQTDTKMVSLESIVSNLYYGIWRSADLFGGYMKSGYLPDTFGFSGQVPMILSQFDIDNFIFWRGTDYEAQGIGPYFWWEGQDGSRVCAINLFGSYGMAKGLTASRGFITNVYNPLMEQYSRITDSRDILMPVGNDQYQIVKDLDKKISLIGPELVIDSYEGFAATIKSQLKGDSVCLVPGTGETGSSLPPRKSQRRYDEKRPCAHPDSHGPGTGHKAVGICRLFHGK